MSKRLRTTLTLISLLSVGYCPMNQAFASEGGVKSTAKTSVAPPSAAPAPETTRTVTGVVVDSENDEPLLGATVQVVGDPKSTVATNIDGEFTIKFKSNLKNPKLVVTYVGYEKQEVNIADLATIRIAMKPAGNSLNEIVVVGAGTQKKVSVTGAISSVKGDDLKMSSSTLTTNLAGKFAGVYANNTSGQPGSGAEFYIRGISNFAGKSATPLILLDDVEISASDLNYIPAENISSFSVLKDASATAIYGARGANGVMIITTKGGEYNSKTNINIQVENAFNILNKMPEFVDGATYMELYNKAQYGRTPAEALRYSQEQIDRTRSGENPYLYPDVDWGETLFKKMATRQKASINVSGGGSKVKYYMALEVLHENGHYRTKKLYSWNNNIQNYNYTFQSNIAYKLTPTTTVSMNMNAQIRQNTRPNIGATDLFNYVLQYNPTLFPVTYPARDGYDHILYGTYELAGGVYLDNPWAQMTTSLYQSNQNTVNTVMKIDQTLDFITKGLKFQGWVNFKSWAQKYYARSISPYTYMPATTVDYNDWQNPVFDLQRGDIGTNYISESDLYNVSDNTFEMQANLNYSRRFDLHDVSAMVLYRMREYRNATILPNRNQGVSGRVTYDYDHRYLFEFNFGYNGTERLAKGYRFGFFPAGSIGWVISNEKFWEPLSNVVSYLKVRGSYGLVGSDDLVKPNGSYFLYYDQIAGNNLNGLTWQPGAGGGAGWGASLGGPQITYYGVRNLGWEKVKKLDVGVDIHLFRELNLTFDYFHDKRYDMFMQRQSWPAMLGYGDMMPYAAVGRAENKGFEGSLTYTKALNSETSISVTGNFTYNKNKLVNADELNYPHAWQYQTGLPLNHTRGYIAEGYFQTQEEIDNSPVQNLGSQVKVGDIKYRDLNGDGQINQDDQTMISEYGSVPRLQYGFGGTINWRKFDFGFFFTGSAKRTLLLTGAQMDGVNNQIFPFQQTPGNAPRNVLSAIAESYFDPERGNFDAEFPLMGIQVTDVANNTVASTHWMRSGSFLRLRNVELGWSFPLGRVYVSGNNLLNFSSFKYWDPELTRWNSYPLQKTVTVGVQFNL